MQALSLIKVSVLKNNNIYLGNITNSTKIFIYGLPIFQQGNTYVVLDENNILSNASEPRL